jgi:hypothetical protein
MYLDGSNDLKTGLQGDPGRGRPSTSRNTGTIANFHEMVTRDRHWALRMMADELNIRNDSPNPMWEPLTLTQALASHSLGVILC